MDRIDEVSYCCCRSALSSAASSHSSCCKAGSRDGGDHLDDRLRDGVCRRHELRLLHGLFLASLPAFYVLVMTSEYRRKRVFAFLNPWDDPLGSGFQMIQSMIAVATGGHHRLRADGRQENSSSA